MITRRVFSKIITTMVGGSQLTSFSEPLVKMEDSLDWITDKGDYYIVKVPNFKIFSKEVLNKPSIFILGQEATISKCSVFGFVNITAPNNGRVVDCLFDGRYTQTEKDRTTIHIAKSMGLRVEGCTVLPPEQSSLALWRNYEPPSPDRWKIRSTTFTGIATAMAQQWL